MRYNFEILAESGTPEGSEFLACYKRMVNTIENNIEMEVNENEFFHDEIIIDIKAEKDLKSVIMDMSVWDFPTPEFVTDVEGAYIYPTVIVKEIKGQTAKIELKYEVSFSDDKFAFEIHWGEFE